MDYLKTIPVKVNRLSEAIYNMPVRFDKLSNAHRLELLRLRMQGCTIEVWSASVDGWREVKYPMWRAENCYRVKRTANEQRIAELEDELLALADETTRKEKELELLLR